MVEKAEGKSADEINRYNISPSLPYRKSISKKICLYQATGPFQQV